MTSFSACVWVEQKTIVNAVLSHFLFTLQLIHACSVTLFLLSSKAYILRLMRKNKAPLHYRNHEI